MGLLHHHGAYGTSSTRSFSAFRQCGETYFYEGLAWQRGNADLTPLARIVWDWDGMCYRERDPEEVRSFVWKLLAAAEKYGKAGKLVRFEPNPANVTATIDALKGVTHLSDAPMPGWMGAGRPTGDLCEIVACQNGLLHVESRVLLPHTPRFWSANALDFGYDPHRGSCNSSKSFGPTILKPKSACWRCLAIA
jgi:D5 N terminal like